MFRLLEDFAQDKAGEVHRRISAGEAAVQPYMYKGRTGCDYCPYRHICGFDSTLPGYGYREISKMKQEEALLRIQAYEADRQEKGKEQP